MNIPEEYLFLITSVIALVIFVAFVLVRKLLLKIILRLCTPIHKKNSITIEHISKLLKKPSEYAWVISGAYIALIISPFTKVPNLDKPPLIIYEPIYLDVLNITVISQTYRALIILCITAGIYNVIEIYETKLLEISARFIEIDNSLLIRFSTKIVRFLIILVGLGVAFSTFVENLDTILTGVGLSGLVVTFVGKDIFTNILNGIMLMIDKPFGIGDWIELSSFEGVVEDVTLRSIRVRTFTQGVVVIPNTTVANDNIINWSAMKKRRIKFTIGVAYNTPKENIEVITKSIHNMLDIKKYVEKDTALVYFDNYGDSSLDIEIICYSLKTDFASYCELKEEINLNILDILDKNNVEIAFPTRTIHIKN
ncbi:MAG: hypothetical protein BEN19_05020 [Epulopiscium sp. Nuni2H_MBin003]|nr:MAG: hypothetical protein BEN19_05020 [Epulopiscium sp. Nuni2H_MBin003]